MRPDDRHPDGRGGIPDGLLVGAIAFLLGMTALTWTATGLAGLLAHGSWPTGVTFARTPTAMRQLVAEPHDIPGAWPDAPAAGLSGYGLFWGLFIGQMMVLVVLTVFVLGTLARWKAVRQRRRAAEESEAERAEKAEAEKAVRASRAAEKGAEAVADASAPGVREVPVPRAPHRPPAPQEAPAQQPPAQEATARPEPAPLAAAAQSTRADGWEAHHRPARAVHYGAPEARATTAAQAVRDAEGPALVVTSNPALWQDTKDARAKLGPVHLYDPAHLCDTPSRLHWSPTAGCEDKQTAARRATALLTPVRPTAKLDQAVGDTAETLLRSYLHAAAIDGRTVRHVHRWSQGIQVQDAVRILRTSPKAAPGAAGELEGALTAHPERRDMAHQLTARALSALSTVNIREACTPNRADGLALDSFIHEGGSLYVVGEPLEDPRTDPGAMPLLTALVSSVVERGRRMAERSSSGRLDPPMTLVLDDVAAVAPLPQLPELLASGADQGLPTLALLRSREQGRARWPHDELPV
ncbi:type IV secretory system conjugative DNA transfer family protein [Streptomyces poriticola]|uniref:type IV secretory system conjugative DNA transfer family protein n=1 Tax=Streptomyces poriticola TaxID=3120506 RepID=UPI002FCE276F